MRVKLLTLWQGPLPVWIDHFRERMSANRLFEWDLMPLDALNLNCLGALGTGVPCGKGSFYAASCDLRPMYGRMFSESLMGYDWWGWCDVDVVLGDLDGLLGPLLDDHDVITTDATGVSGPLTLLRNAPECLDLWRNWRSTELHEMLADPDYWNFDETGFDNPSNPSFTELVRHSGLRVHWDDRLWTESRDTIEDGLPSRSCRPEGNRLYEIPTGRELLGYHFTLAPKTWPIPNRFCSSDERLRELQEQWMAMRATLVPAAPTVGVESPEYWDRRVRRVRNAREPLHKVVIDTPPGDWDRIQHQTAEALREHVPTGCRLLDAGCGHGALLDALALIPRKVRYTGVDYSRSMIELFATTESSRTRHPPPQFVHADIRSLPLDTDSFDWAVCRGLEGTARTLQSNRDWSKMRNEMLRVAQRLLVIDYSGGHRVVERT